MEETKQDQAPRFPITPFKLWCGPGATTMFKKKENKKRPKLHYLQQISQKKGSNDFWEHKKQNDVYTFYARQPLPLEDAQQIVKSRSTSPPTIVDLSEHGRYYSLERQDFENAKSAKPGDTVIEWRKRRQRTAWWHTARVLCLSGSRLTNAINMFDEMQYFETWLKTYDPENKFLAEIEASVDAKTRDKSNETMAWGTYHEIDAMATFIHHLGEKLNFDVFEATLTQVKLPKDAIENVLKPCVLKKRQDQKWTDKDDEIWVKNFLKDSPDGIGRDRKTGEFFMIEFKCPYGLRQPIAYEKCKYYQYPQKQLHMVTDLSVQFRLAQTPELKYCYLVSWAPDVTRVFKVQRNPSFWKEILPILVDFHSSGLEKKLPSEPPKKAMTDTITAYCKKYSAESKFIGSFPSCWSRHRGSEVETAQLRKYFPDEKEESIL